MKHVIKEIMPEIKKLDLSDRKAAVNLYSALLGMLTTYSQGVGPNWDHKKKFFPGDPKPEHQKWIKNAPDARLATIVKMALKDHPEILKAFDGHQIDKKRWASVQVVQASLTWKKFAKRSGVPGGFLFYRNPNGYVITWDGTNKEWYLSKNPQQLAGAPEEIGAFGSVKEAMQAANNHAAGHGGGGSGELKETEAVLKKYGYNPADAKKLQQEGMGPEEVEQRAKVPGNGVGSLEHSHGLKRAGSAKVEGLGGGGRRYPRDPVWIKAKYPGTDHKGKPFKKGDRVLYWPNDKSFMQGPEAEQAWKEFQGQIADEIQYNS